MKKILILLFLPFALVANEPGLISFGGGIYEVVRNNHNTTAEFRVEWRPSAVWHTIRPTLGFMMTVRGSTYLYLGFGFDWILKKHFILSPNFAAGWYSKGGGKDLGFPLEFRSGIEMAWRFKNASRAGVHFYHLSNASMGWKNPGEESLVFFFSLPI